MLVAIGVIFVVGMSALLGWLYTGIISFGSNPQITGRVSPTMVDLIAALASGAAGAFCMSREDISDSLAGVAIAISLVPPLCVVGLSVQAGHWSDAAGALLLFVTNFLSILLAGGAVLAILGLSRAANARIVGPGAAQCVPGDRRGHVDRLCSARHHGPSGDGQLPRRDSEQSRCGKLAPGQPVCERRRGLPGGQRQGPHHGYGPTAAVHQPRQTGCGRSWAGRWPCR